VPLTGGVGPTECEVVARTNPPSRVTSSWLLSGRRQNGKRGGLHRSPAVGGHDHHAQAWDGPPVRVNGFAVLHSVSALRVTRPVAPSLWGCVIAGIPPAGDRNMQQLLQYLCDTLIGGMVLVSIQAAWTAAKVYVSGE